jgi:hypothetical protein
MSQLKDAVVEGLKQFHGQSLKDAFILAQIQAVIEDLVWTFVPTAKVKLAYVDAASLLAVYEVEGMMVHTVRVQMTPEPSVVLTYLEPERMYDEANTCACGCGLEPGHYDKPNKAEQEIS